MIPKRQSFGQTQRAYRPIATQSRPKASTDNMAVDQTMMAQANLVSAQRGFGGKRSGYGQYMYRKMKYNQSVAINKSGSDRGKSLNSFYSNTARVFNVGAMNRIYGLYQDQEEDEMFNAKKPFQMEVGDKVFNNIAGFIGVLQERRQHGDNTVLVFQDRTFSVKGDVHGWSVLQDNHGEQHPDSEFDAEELRMGIEDEGEHTEDPEMRKKIAKDHLIDDPHFYSNDKKAKELLKNEKTETSDMMYGGMRPFESREPIAVHERYHAMSPQEKVQYHSNELARLQQERTNVMSIPELRDHRNKLFYHATEPEKIKKTMAPEKPAMKEVSEDTAPSSSASPAVAASSAQSGASIVSSPLESEKKKEVKKEDIENYADYFPKYQDLELADDYKATTGPSTPGGTRAGGVAHTWEGGHKAFHAEMKNFAAQHNLPAGSRVAVFPGAQTPSRLPETHMMSHPSFFGRTGDVASHKEGTAFMQKDVNAATAHPRHLLNMYAHPTASKKYSLKAGGKDYSVFVTTPEHDIKSHDPHEMMRAGSSTAVAPVHAMEHWKAHHEELKAMPTDKMTPEEHGLHQAKLQNFEAFFKHMSETPEKMTQTGIGEHMHPALKGYAQGLKEEEPRALPAMFNQLHKHVVPQTRLGSESGISPGFTSPKDKSNWAIGAVPAGESVAKKVERGFLGAVRRVEPISHGVEARERSIDIHNPEHFGAMLKANPTVRMHYKGEGGRVESHAETSLSDIPHAVMEGLKAGKGYPYATTLHGQLEKGTKAPVGSTSAYRAVTGAWKQPVKERQAASLLGPGASASEVKGLSKMVTGPGVAQQFGKTGRTEEKRVIQPGARLPKTDVDFPKERPIIKTTVAVKGTIGSATDMPKGATRTAILGGTGMLGKDVGEVIKEGGAYRGGSEAGTRIREINASRTKEGRIFKQPGKIELAKEDKSREAIAEASKAEIKNKGIPKPIPEEGVREREIGGIKAMLKDLKKGSKE